MKDPNSNADISMKETNKSKSKQKQLDHNEIRLDGANDDESDDEP